MKKMILSAMFAALLIVATQFSIPIGPVPVTMQPFVVMLAGLVLGAAWGAASVGIWALLGLAGFPVFAGGKAGIAVLVGPTGGFVVGFIFCAFLIGRLTDHRQIQLRTSLAAVFSGLIMAYVIGLAGFLFNMHYFLHKQITLQESLALAVFPFLPWDVVKAVLASIIGVKINKALNAMGYRV